jgi:phage-related protein
VGISFQDVAGAIATMTQHGTSAAEATQELNNTIRGLVAPNQVAQKAMQQLGINVVDLEKNVGKRGLAGSINLIVDAIGKHLGPAGTVVVDAFKKSQSAGQDLQIMLSKMPPDLKSISQGFLDGTVSAKDYRMGFKDMGAQGSAMGQQFMALSMQANGFNDLLKSGQPAAQSFTMYLKQMMGGATGMNTALQLTGASSAYFNKAVKAIGEAAGKSGKDIDTWALTQKNAATQMGRLKASVQVLGVEIGQVILPILVKIANGVTNVIKGFNGLSDTWQKVIAYGALAVASFLLLASAMIKMYTMVMKLREIWLVIKALSIWTKIAAAAQWLWNGALAAFAALEEVTGIGLIVAAIVLLVAAIVLIIKYHKQIWTFVKMVWGDIWSFMKVIGAWFAGPFVNFFVAVWHGIMVAFNAVKAVVMAVVNFVIGYVMFWYNMVKGIVMFFAPLFKAVFGLIRAIIELELKLIWLFISAILLAMKFLFLTTLHAIEAVWNAVWHAMSVAAHAIWGAIGPYVMGTLRALASFFRAVWGGIRSVAISIWNAIYSYIRGKVNAIIAVAKTIGRIVAIVVGFFAKIQSGVNTQIGKLLGLVGTIAGKVLHAIGNLGSVLYNAGKDIIQGLINGVSSKINALTDKLHSITKLIPHIKGPEVVDKKLLTPNGRMIMEGLVAGIDSMVPVLHKQLAGLTKTIPVNVLATATTHTGGVVHGGGAPIRSTIPPNQTNKSAASAGRHFGPYHMMLDKGVVASFVIDTVTGNPTIISTTTQKGNRKRAWAGGRKPTS